MCACATPPSPLAPPSTRPIARVPSSSSHSRFFSPLSLPAGASHQPPSPPFLCVYALLLWHASPPSCAHSHAAPRPGLRQCACDATGGCQAASPPAPPLLLTTFRSLAASRIRLAHGAFCVPLHVLPSLHPQYVSVGPLPSSPPCGPRFCRPGYLSSHCLVVLLRKQ